MDSDFPLKKKKTHTHTPECLELLCSNNAQKIFESHAKSNLRTYKHTHTHTLHVSSYCASRVQTFFKATRIATCPRVKHTCTHSQVSLIIWQHECTRLFCWSHANGHLPPHTHTHSRVSLYDNDIQIWHMTLAVTVTHIHTHTHFQVFLYDIDINIEIDIQIWNWHIGITLTYRYDMTVTYRHDMTVTLTNIHMHTHFRVSRVLLQHKRTANSLKSAHLSLQSAPLSF